MSEPHNKEELILEGIAASPGVAHGRAVVYLQKQLDVPCFDIKEDQVDAELERFDKAILETRAEIADVRDKIAQSLGEGEAGIFDAHLLVLEDNALLEEVSAELNTSMKNIEFCYNNVAQRYISFFRSMEDEYLRERVADIGDVSRRLLHNLIGMQKVNLGDLASESIIVSEDISPSDAADLDRNKLLGFVTDCGGKTSHSVIMARSLRIPAVVGTHDGTKKIVSGDHILVDGHKGIVVIIMSSALSALQSFMMSLLSLAFDLFPLEGITRSLEAFCRQLQVQSLNSLMVKRQYLFISMLIQMPFISSIIS